MDRGELNKILNDHKRWLCSEGGSRADLRGADLSGANLRNAYLSDADLSGANLRNANLSDADLSGANLRNANLRDANLSDANLRNANLSDADLRDAYLRNANLSDAYLRGTVYDGINWLLLLGVVPDKDGRARAYKVTNSSGEGIYQGGINYAEQNKFSVPSVDKYPYTQCSYGINLATLAWCITEKRDGYRLFMMEFSASSRNCVCPVGSDGKFRVKSCIKIGECNWKGELLDNKQANKRKRRNS